MLARQGLANARAPRGTGPRRKFVALVSPCRASTTGAQRRCLRRGNSSCTLTKTERSASIRVYPRPKLYFVPCS